MMRLLLLSALGALALFGNVTRVMAGDYQFCDLYTINSIAITGIDCYTADAPPMNMGSDLSTYQNAPIYKICYAPFGTTSLSMDFASTSTGDGPTQYTGRRQSLYRGYGTLIGTSAPGTPLVYDWSSTTQPPYVIYSMIHDFIGSDGEPDICQTALNFNIRTDPNPADCAKYQLDTIQFQNLQCDKPLTGLAVPFGSEYAGNKDTITCAVPEGVTSFEALFSYSSSEQTPPAVSIAHTRMFYSDYSSSFDADLPDPLVYTFPAPVPTESVLEMDLVMYQPPEGYASTCRARYLIQLVDSLGVIPEVDDCNAKTDEQCINHFGNQTNCHYDFTNQICVDQSNAVDACQVQTTQNGCNTASCFWDPYISSCLSSLSQVNSVFECNDWNAFSPQSGPSSPACAFHGCKFDSNTRECVNSNETLSANPTTPNEISVEASFVNIAVDTNAQTLNFQVVVPFVYTTATPTNPKFPIIQLLFGTNDASSYSKLDEPSCSSFAAGSPVPAAFSTTVDPAAVNAFLLTSVASTGNLTFDTNAPEGAVLAKVFGAPDIGPSSIVKSVAYDGAKLTYNVTVNLITATRDCGLRGVQSTTDPDGRQYVMPVSYVEHSRLGLYAQAVQTFQISVPLSGSVSIGTQASYGFAAFPVAVSFVQGVDFACEVGQGRMKIRYQVESYNAYDPNVRIGVMSTPDMLYRSPDSPQGPVNCYGDSTSFGPSEFSAIVCDYSQGICTQQLTTWTLCRPLNANGDAFNKCEYALPADREADLGPDGVYSTELDALHTLFMYRRACPLTQGDFTMCPIVGATSSNMPETVSTRITGSSYLDAEENASNFLVTSGMLQSGTSEIGQQLGGQEVDGVTYFTLSESSPITLYAILTEASRDRVELKVNIDGSATRFVGLNTQGAPLQSVSGYTGLGVVTYTNIANRLLYVAKRQFQNQCGFADQCRTLPACEGIIGCDGFSLPAAQLRAILPAAQYEMVLSYNLGLDELDANAPQPGGLEVTGANSTVPTAAAGMRRLLQTGSSTTTTQTLTRTFRFTITSNNVTSIVEGSSNSTLVTTTEPPAAKNPVKFFEAFSNYNYDTAMEALYMGGVAPLAFASVAFVVVSKLSKSLNSANPYSF